MNKKFLTLIVSVLAILTGALPVLGIAGCLMEDILLMCIGFPVGIISGIFCWIFTKKYNEQKEREKKNSKVKNQHSNNFNSKVTYSQINKEKHYSNNSQEKVINNQINKDNRYLKWLNDNYESPQKIFFDEYNYNNGNYIEAKNTAVFVSEKSRVIIFGEKVISYEDIVDVEMITSATQEAVTTEKRQGIGKALVGGILGGVTGAIIGASVTKKTAKTDIVEKERTIGVILYLADVLNPTFEYKNWSDSVNKTVYNTVYAIINKVKREKEKQVENDSIIKE